jgi:hypothetical protein
LLPLPCFVVHQLVEQMDFQSREREDADRERFIIVSQKTSSTGRKRQLATSRGALLFLISILPLYSPISGFCERSRFSSLPTRVHFFMLRLIPKTTDR